MFFDYIGDAERGWSAGCQLGDATKSYHRNTYSFSFESIGYTFF